MLFITINYNVD
jgi:aminopeptidase N